MTRFLRFGVVGACGFVVDAGTVEALTRTAEVSALLARIPAFVLATWVTWRLNRRFTFDVQLRPTLAEWFAYTATNLLGLTINYLSFALALHLSDTAKHYPAIGVAVGSAAAMLVNYLLMRSLWRGKARAVPGRLPDPSDARRL